jgi:hypothetical protein
MSVLNLYKKRQEVNILVINLLTLKIQLKICRKDSESVTKFASPGVCTL